MVILKATNQNRQSLNSYKIAHELRNPLTNIMLSCEHIKEEIRKETIDKSSFTNYLEIIERSCGRMNQLIYDFAQSDKLVREGNKSLDKILEESLTLAADRINLKKITVEKSFTFIKTVFSTEPENLRIAFLNIIINAIESMETGKGVLQIITCEDDSSFYVKFSDNGSGIHKCEQHKLFQPNFTNKKNGLGIGLTITRNVLAQINATIHVESEFGKGSVFIVRFQKEDFLLNQE